MNGPYHYRKAEQFLRKGKDIATGEIAREVLMAAGVHAQLAAIALEAEKTLEVVPLHTWSRALESEVFEK